MPGTLWAHNDSGPSVLVALGTDGAVKARVRLAGVRLLDWEAVATGPCPAGSCVFAADIGDNDAARRRVSIYRFPEPGLSQPSVPVRDVFYGAYPDGPQDAETLLVTPDGDIFIVTKGETAGIGLYRFPRDLRAGATHPLARVGRAPADGKVKPRSRITDGSVSPDGRWVVLRTNTELQFYRASAFLAGSWTVDRTMDLSALKEPQGEAVAVGANGDIFVGGEGGRKGEAGTFSRACWTNEK